MIKRMKIIGLWLVLDCEIPKGAVRAISIRLLDGIPPHPLNASACTHIEIQCARTPTSQKKIGWS